MIESIGCPGERDHLELLPRTGYPEDSSGRTIIESPGIFLFSRRSAPFGFNGGFYYARLSLRF